MPGKRLFAVALVVVAGSLAVRAFVPPFLQVGTGITAKQLCSLTFVSGFSPDRAWQLYLKPFLQPFSPLIHFDVDEGVGEVRSSILGLAWRSLAAHREGLGCTLVHGDATAFDATATAPRPPVGSAPAMVLDRAWRDAHFDENALTAAVEDALAAPDPSHTLAVVVLHEGRLVADALGNPEDPPEPQAKTGVARLGECF